jgi:hypothetical protein
VSDYSLDDQGSNPGRSEKIFPLASVSRPALGSTQSPVNLVPGVLSTGIQRGRGVKLTTFRSSAEVRNEELYILFPLAPAWLSGTALLCPYFQRLSSDRYRKTEVSTGSMVESEDRVKVQGNQNSLFFFFSVPVCAITALAVPGGTFCFYE